MTFCSGLLWRKQKPFIQMCFLFSSVYWFFLRKIISIISLVLAMSSEWKKRENFMGKYLDISNQSSNIDPSRSSTTRGKKTSIKFSWLILKRINYLEKVFWAFFFGRFFSSLPYKILRKSHSVWKIDFKSFHSILRFEKTLFYLSRYLK